MKFAIHLACMLAGLTVVGLDAPARAYHGFAKNVLTAAKQNGATKSV